MGPRSAMMPPIVRVVVAGTAKRAEAFENISSDKQQLVVHLCAGTDQFLETVAAPAGILVIDAHGWEGRDDDPFAFKVGPGWVTAEDIGEARGFSASTIILGACFPLKKHPSGFRDDERENLLGGRAYLGGVGIVQRHHIPVLVRWLVRNVPCGPVGPAEGKAILERAVAAYPQTHDQKIRDEKGRDLVWSVPTIGGRAGPG